MDTTQGGRYVGSYGRETANDWVSDIDMLFEMPWSLHTQYSNYIGNGQSAFLQAVKNSIEKTYPDSKMAGDGQVVKVKFSDNTFFEVLPAFKNTDNSFTYANSNSGGSWQTTNPIPEIEAINSGNNSTNYNLRELCRMIRSWKYYCDVPIKGILIDTLAHRFLTNWEHRNQSYLYYDWMSRDFFEYLKNQSETQTIWYALGSSQTIYNPDNFRYKATVAFNISKAAIEYHRQEKEWSAKQEWRKIYGNRFPD